MGPVEGILCAIGFLFVALYIQKHISKANLKKYYEALQIEAKYQYDRLKKEYDELRGEK